MSTKCYNHKVSNKPHPLCGCLQCESNRKLYVQSPLTPCLKCHCKGQFKFIKPGHANQCGICHHSFTKHYCN